MPDLALGLMIGEGDAQAGVGPVPGFQPSTLSGNFDGTNDYVAIDDASGLAIDGDVSISLWFNSASLPGSAAYDYMFSLTDGRSTGSDRAIGIRGTGSDAQIVGNTYGSGWNLPFTNTSIAVDTWYHVVAVFTSGSVQIYLDGLDKGSKTVATVDPTTPYQETVIGGMLYSGVNHFNGLIDEVSVFASALSASNVTAIYNSGAPDDIESLNPVGWWRMGSGTGDTNSSGGVPANTGAIGTVANQGSLGSSSNGTGTNGPTFSSNVPVSRYSTRSIDFDGADDYLLMGASAINLDTDFTISTWFKPASGALAGYDFIGGWGNNASGQARVMQILNSKLSFEIYLSRISGATTLSADTWYHGAVTFSTNAVEIFLNGVSDGTGSLSRSSLASSETFIGGTLAMSAAGFVPFAGLIDEFAVFDSVLSDPDILAIYNSGTPADLTSLSPVGWWRMGDGTEDGSGTTIYDMSSNSNNGTLTNGPTFSSTTP